MELHNSTPKGAEQSNSWTEVTTQSPCPKCGVGKWCQVNESANRGICRRNDCGDERVDKSGTRYWVYELRPQTYPALSTDAGSPDERDQVYRFILNELTLAENHRDHLRKRGLNTEEIELRGYRTMPVEGRAKIGTAVVEAFGFEIASKIPGVIKKKSKTGADYITLTGAAGIIIPIRDEDGRIHSLQVRKDTDGEAKYSLVSSKKKDGCGPGLTTHVPIGGVLPDRTVRLTEGILKSDVATALSGLKTIGMPGITNFKTSMPILKALDVKTVVFAPDADFRSNPNVRKSVKDCVSDLIADGFAIEFESWDHSNGVKGVDDALSAGLPTTRRLIQDMGALDQLLSEFDLRESSDRETQAPAQHESTGLPTICISNTQLRSIISSSWRAIHRVNTPTPIVFRGFKTLVRLQSSKYFTGQAESFEIEILNVDLVYGLLVRHADWMRVNKEGDLTAARPPKECARDMLAYPDLSLPRLEHIISSPQYNANGELITKGGYYPKEFLFFDPRGELDLGEIPEAPTAEQVIEAVEIIKEPFKDFPFVSDADRLHALSRPIGILGRRMVAGCTPLQLTEAETPGTGKGLVEKILSLITTGKVPEPTTLPVKEEEVKKTITSLLLRGLEQIKLDNADDTEKLHSPSLAAVLTTIMWSDRILGVSQFVSVPNWAEWSLTGNNTTLSSELSRRTVRARLESDTDQPWRRPESDFSHPDLENWVLENRVKIVRAYIILIENWKAKGRPKGKKRLGSFEAWSEFIGGVLDAAGIGEHFLGNLDNFYAAADVDGTMWREFAKAWWERFKNTSQTVAELNKFCSANDLMASERGPGLEQSQVIKLGIALKKKIGRPIGDFVLLPGKENGKKGKLYLLERRKMADDTASNMGCENQPNQSDRGVFANDAPPSAQHPPKHPPQNSSADSGGCENEGVVGDVLRSYTKFSPPRSGLDGSENGTHEPAPTCPNSPNIPRKSPSPYMQRENRGGTLSVKHPPNTPQHPLATMDKGAYDEI